MKQAQLDALHTLMKNHQILSSLWILFLSFMAAAGSSSSERSWMVKPGCPEVCGSVEIPFPFGLGFECSLNESFLITCKDSSGSGGAAPYLSIQSESSEEEEVQVLSIGLWDQTIIIKSPVPPECHSQQSSNASIRRFSTSLEGTPFFNKEEYVPVLLSWTLHSSDVQGISGCVPKNVSFRTQNGKSYNSVQCGCGTIHGSNFTIGYGGYNPYVDGACTQVMSILFDGGKKNRTAAIVGASVGLGVLALLLAIYSLYNLLKRRHHKKIKEKLFKRNGGLLLQQQLSAQEGVVEKTEIFSASELNKASDGFNANRILGQGGQGTVYKGMLTDGRIVAIKKSKKVDESQLEQFINEVVILSQVNHRNVVKLLGCCLETQVPLLVYEFIPNGTLFSLIHSKNNDEEFALTWNVRMRIAKEVAGALAYLHSAISIPIFHRDIKSSNILLDEKYVAKVSDFGTSRSLATDKTHLTTRVQGTFGYLDPEYFQSSQYTEKSDVYSFGVVLVELLTSQKPISEGTNHEDGFSSLATRFLTAMDQNSLSTILDPQVVDESNEDKVTMVAKLAQKCLNLNGKKRPTMKEVAFVLESIKRTSVPPSAVEENCQTSKWIEGKYSEFSDTDYSWTMGSDSIRITSSMDSPLLVTISDQ